MKKATQPEVRQRIKQLLDMGYSTSYNLVCRTGLSLNTVRRVLRDLRRDGVVRCIQSHGCVGPRYYKIIGSHRD